MFDFIKSRTPRLNKVLIRFKIQFNLVKSLNLILIEIKLVIFTRQWTNLIFYWIKILINFGQILKF